MTKVMKIDLHCHSTASDGSLSPNQLIDLAVKHEVTHLAITDHDTTAGYMQALDYAKNNQVELISGVEASCDWQGHTIHIVGLDFDVTNSALQQGLQHIRNLRLERAALICERLQNKARVNIDNLEEKLNDKVGEGVVGRNHIAQILVEHDLVKNTQQAFDRYLKKGRPGYVAASWPSLQQIVEWIVQAGGIAVIAHPGIYKFTSSKLNRMITDFKAAGGQAIEVVNQPRHSAEINGMADRAKRFELWASVGSDFHRPEHTWRGLGWLAPLPQTVTPVWAHFKQSA
ncbi:PHP domain-containing protein [Thiomicrorhabdus sediminis]|nr:PHP domain-containing protein [Thiomicrorhabdus sediminis]